MSKRTLIRGKFVIGHDGRDHVVYRDGVVVYEGDSILYVGHDFAGHVDEEWDTGLSIISPGFIDLDADVDTDHALIDVAFPRNKQDAFQMSTRFRTADPFSQEDFRVRQRYSIVQLIMNGITTAMPIAGELFRGWCQTYDEFEEMARNAADLGLRMYLGPSYRAAAWRGTFWDMERGEQSLQDAFRFHTKHDGSHGGLIRGFLNPCQVVFLTEDFLLRTTRFSAETGAPIRLHACESPREWEYLLPLHGKTSVEYFDSIGLLSSRLLIPHAIAVKDSELPVLAERGVSIVHTPFAEANVGWALHSFGKYQAAGVNITMGTDAQPDDMIRNLRFAWDLARLFETKQIYNRYGEDNQVINHYRSEPQYPRTTAADFFRAATTNGAKALGRDDLGKLSAGAKADIVVIDLDDLRVGPYDDPIRTLIMSCTGHNVRHTIINGRTVMKDRMIPSLDEAKLKREAQQVYEKFVSLYGEFDAFHRPTDTFFPPSFPEIKKQ